MCIRDRSSAGRRRRSSRCPRGWSDGSPAAACGHSSRTSRRPSTRLFWRLSCTPQTSRSPARRRSDALLEELRALDATLATLDVDYAEWEVLYRMRLQIERDLLVGSPVGQALRCLLYTSPSPRD